MTPLSIIAFISDNSFDNFKRVVEDITTRVWTQAEREYGRSVYSGCTGEDWPAFKAYFEALGWEVIPCNMAAHSGYVENAIIKPKRVK